MRGVGKQIWAQEPGDIFVERLRSEASAAPFPNQPETSGQPLSDTVWRRVETHQGDEFHTATGLPFTYEVEGAGIWFFRQGKRINRKLTRTQVEKAVDRCPLGATTEIKDLMDYAYLFGLLTDVRIKSELW
jgi:hypothetical protein